MSKQTANTSRILAVNDAKRPLKIINNERKTIIKAAFA